jgi:tRNA (cmo5U34)-methyltransferase
LYVMTDVADIFDAHAETYDEARRRLIPPFDAFYETAVGALRLGDRAPERILDLGAGTGLLSRWLRARYPAAHITLVDSAGLMLEKARQLLGDERLTYVEADLNGTLPSGPWDAIVSALAIHHLEDNDKQRLFERIRTALGSGGVFVNAEQVAGPTPFLTGVYAAWHEERARVAGSDDDEWSAAVERMAFDRCATVEDQLRWLRDAGFTHADCLFKHHRFAVIVAL